MRLTRVPQAVIFDLDGVLLDTEPLYTTAASAVTQRFGKRFDWDLKRKTMGTDPVHGAALVIEALQLPLSVDEYLAERAVHLSQLFIHSPPMPGAPQWVRALAEYGMPLAIGTSSVRPLCEVKWAANPWLSDISIRICGDDAAVARRKPAPDIFLAAAARLERNPADCLVFEDSPAGVAAARAAGMQVIAIKAPELPLEDVAQADLVVSGYHELSLTDLGLNSGRD